MNRKNFINIIFIILISVGLVSAYITTLYFLQKYSDIDKCNEFGDYIGGVLGPLFTLLTTLAIIYLTYILAKNEERKAEKSIETQKRLTLNQMRQDALNRFVEKLNLFVNDLNRMTVIKPNTKKFVKLVLSHNSQKSENRDLVKVWLIISSELESFLQFEYLFKGLFERENFLKTFKLLQETVFELLGEESSNYQIEESTLVRYLETKQELITLIGDYIYSEF